MMKTEICRAAHAAGIEIAPAGGPADTAFVFGAISRVLTESGVCSSFFRQLAKADALGEFLPELAKTIGIEQNPAFHPEGDVFEHTMCVIDAAAALRVRAAEPLPFMLAALFHDLGKIVATTVRADGRIIAYGHEVKGLPLVDAQMRRLTQDEKLIRTVCNHSKLHMRPNMLYGARSKKRKTRELFDESLCPNDLILLSRADASGKKDAPYDEECEQWLRQRLEDYEARMHVPHLSGADLQKACDIPGSLLSRFDARARKLHLCGLDSRAIARQIRAEVAETQIICK